MGKKRRNSKKIKKVLQILQALVTLSGWSKRERSGVNAGRRVGNYGLGGASPFDRPGQSRRQGPAKAPGGIAGLVQEVECSQCFRHNGRQEDSSNLPYSAVEVHIKYVGGPRGAREGRR